MSIPFSDFQCDSSKVRKDLMQNKFGSIIQVFAAMFVLMPSITAIAMTASDSIFLHSDRTPFSQPICMH